MNKKRVNDMLLVAKEALSKCGIADENGKINHTYRGQISTFGAAVIMGSLPAAVAFFSDRGGSSVERQKLISAMYYCIFKEEKEPKDILEYVCKNNSPELKEQMTDASIALKLAMNFYELVQGGKKNEKSESDI